MEPFLSIEVTQKLNQLLPRKTCPIKSSRSQRSKSSLINYSVKLLAVPKLVIQTNSRIICNHQSPSLKLRFLLRVKRNLKFSNKILNRTRRSLKQKRNRKIGKPFQNQIWRWKMRLKTTTMRRDAHSLLISTPSAYFFDFL